MFPISAINYLFTAITEDTLRQDLDPFVKEEQVESVVEAMDQTFGTQKVENLTLLTGGRGTSTILKFQVKGKPYTCRITDNSRPNFFNDPKTEIRNMTIASELGITPKLHYADPKTGVLIMDFVVNKPLPMDTEYKQFAQKLAQLHNGPNFTEQMSNIFTDVARVAKACNSHCMPATAHTVIETIFSLEEVLKKHQTNAPCHKELNGNNVLYNGSEISFIDWEGSENCDPFVDLAIASIFFIFDPKMEESFLESYLGKPPTKEQKAHLYLMKQVCLAFYAFKAMRRVVNVFKTDLSKDAIDLKSYPSLKELTATYFSGCTKVCGLEDFKTLTYVPLREVLNNIQSQEFKEAIQTLLINQTEK